MAEMDSKKSFDFSNEKDFQEVDINSIEPIPAISPSNRIF